MSRVASVRWKLVAGLGLLAGLAACDADRAVADEPRGVEFSRDVLPILSDRCFHCHGPDERHREAKLRLDRRDHVFAGGIVAPGDARKSELFRRISSSDPELRMPPPSQARQLKPDEIDVVRRWIDQGAEWQEHWAFRPPERPRPPETSHADRARNDIDRFVLARLEREGLQPSPEAEREILLRRVTLDLTGLPPTPAEIDAFLADDSVGAYEQVVDRLLASPRYGEHLATFWMDAARYADTDGYQNDRLRYMWVWRDWLVGALNENMPFDRFTVEQLAGDLLPAPTLRQQIATGFCRNHRINSEGGSIPAEWQVEYVADRVETLGTTWLGLTLGCARCHDHKYDPITQRDFYRLFAYFNNVDEWGLGPNDGNSPPFVEVPQSWPDLSDDEDRAVAPAPFRLITTQTSVVRPNPGGPNTVMVMHERAEPRKTYRLERGQYDRPDKSEELAPAVPPSLGKIEGGGRNDRLALARWLVRPDNPLTARVVVNRFWQRLFGTGLVRTTENFGVQGERPSHPELLDWLATEFVRLGWDVKALHRTIVVSATYRQSSRVAPGLGERDPDNRLLARGPRFRLPSQVIRDQALEAGGLLVDKIGGPSVKPYMPPGLWESISNAKYKQDHGESLYRRSLYTYWRRTIPPPTMLTFDAIEREVCVVRKERTISPLQALTLMNNVTFVEASRMLAERVLKAGPSSPTGRTAFAFRALIGRRPTAEEQQLLGDAFSTFLARFEAEPKAAAQLLAVGEHPRDATLDPALVAAWTMVASTIMNLDEFVTRE